MRCRRRDAGQDHYSTVYLTAAFRSFVLRITDYGVRDTYYGRGATPPFPRLIQVVLTFVYLSRAYNDLSLPPKPEPFTTPNGADDIDLDDAFAIGGQASIRVSGTSDGVPFEAATFFNITNLGH